MVETYNLTATAFSQNGEPIEGATVTARLNKPDFTQDGVNIPIAQTATTDQNGIAVLPLVSNLVGTQDSRYRIIIEDPTGQPILSQTIQMPEIDSDLSLLVEGNTEETPLTGSMLGAQLAKAWATGTEPGGEGTRSAREWAQSIGHVGAFLGLNLIGVSENIEDRPPTADTGVGDAWGLLEPPQDDEDEPKLRVYVNTQEGWFDTGPITTTTTYRKANTVHVQTIGDDNNFGESWQDPVASFERALALAERNDGVTHIEVAAGEYYTEGHLDVPDETIIQAPYRAVVVKPVEGFEERNVFRLGSGCFLEGPIFEGWRLDSLDDPTEGFAVSFRPGAVIRRAPYAHKIAVRSVVDWSIVPPPLDRDNQNPLYGRGAGVALADGKVVSQFSMYPNLITWGATPVSQNGIGYCAKNGGLINAVNAISMWAHKHFMSLKGGQVILSACSTQFGDYTLHADGSRSIIVPYKLTETALQTSEIAYQAIQGNKQTIIDNMWNHLVDNGFVNDYTDEDEELTRRDAGIFLQAMSWVIKTAVERPMLDFAKGLFDVQANPVFDSDETGVFLESFDFMAEEIKNLSDVNATIGLIVDELVANLKNTITDAPSREEPSLITAIGHTWSGVMSGVALTNVPPARNRTRLQDSILETNDGQVISSGQDDEGNAVFVGGLTIDADTGELGGPPFQTAVSRIATRAAIARSF